MFCMRSAKPVRMWRGKHSEKDRNMKIGFTLWPGILLVVLCSQPASAHAQSLQYHDTIYTLPDQWVSGAVRADHVNLIQNAGDQLRLIEMKAAIKIPESESRLLEWIDESLKESMPSYDLDSFGRRKDDIVNRHGQVTERFSFRSSDARLRIACLHVGTEYANLVIYETFRSDQQTASVELENEYANTFLPFCQNLRFVSQGAKPLLGKPTPGELDGIYFQDSSHINHFLSSHSGKPGNYIIKGTKITFDFANGYSKTVDFKPSKTDSFLNRVRSSMLPSHSRMEND